MCRRLIAQALTAALTLACISIAAAQDVKKARLGHSFTDTHPRAAAMKRFAAGVEKATNGKVAIDVFGGAPKNCARPPKSWANSRLKGMSVTEMPVAELDKIRGAVQPVIDKNSEAIGAEFVQAFYGELKKFRARR